jgi:hypothetical protein
MQESLAADRFEEVSAVFERMAAYHPDEPHWYLPMIGVGPPVPRHTLLQCDKDHMAAYLESSNPANVPLYERHGFVILGTSQVGWSPPICLMLRAAR